MAGSARPLCSPPVPGRTQGSPLREKNHFLANLYNLERISGSIVAICAGNFFLYGLV